MGRKKTQKTVKSIHETLVCALPLRLYKKWVVTNVKTAPPLAVIPESGLVG